MTPTRAELALAALVAAGYYGLGTMVFRLLDDAAAGAPWWPAAGLTLGALCVSRRAAWPVLLGAVFAADVAVDLVEGSEPGVSLWWATANTVEPLIGALLLTTLARGRPALESVDDVARFVAVALTAPVAASLFGTAGTVTLLGHPFWEVWPRWYVGDVVGILSVAPVVLAAPRIRAALPDGRFLLGLGAVAAVTTAVFATSVGVLSELPYLVTPVLIVVALRNGVAGAASGVLVMALLANAFSETGSGPFSLVETESDPMIVLQLFVTTQVLTVLLLAGQRASLIDTRGVADALARERTVDPLTGLGNRLMLDRTLAGLTGRGEAVAGGGVAVVYLDVDRFKEINDLFGHGVGDAVLREVGARIAAAVRPADTVVRLGGDEFAVVCQRVTEPDVRSLAERLESALADPVPVGDVSVPARVSVGVSWSAFPLGDPGELLRRADLEMYAVKRARRGRAGSSPRQDDPAV